MKTKKYVRACITFLKDKKWNFSFFSVLRLCISWFLMLLCYFAVIKFQVSGLYSYSLANVVAFCSSYSSLDSFIFTLHKYVENKRIVERGCQSSLNIMGVKVYRLLNLSINFLFSSNNFPSVSYKKVVVWARKKTHCSPESIGYK